MGSKNKIKDLKMTNVSKVNLESRPSTFWDQDDLNDIRKKYLTEVKSVDDWYHFLKNNVHPMVEHASSSHPLNYTELDHPLNVESFTFKKVAQVKSFDVNSTLEKIKRDNQDINVNNSQHCKTRMQHFQSEIEFLESLGFTNYPHVFNPTEENYPEIYKLIENFDLDYSVFQFRIQLPGGTQETHVDALDSMWAELGETVKDGKFDSITKLPFDPVTKCPQGYYAVRFLIPFTPYEPGHVFGFEDEYWTNWTPGDVITFDWANIYHYTANSSLVPRIVLKITGITSNPNHWSFDAVNNNKTIDL